MKMDFESRSLVAFGSLNSSLKKVTDPPMKSDPEEAESTKVLPNDSATRINTPPSHARQFSEPEKIGLGRKHKQSLRPMQTVSGHSGPVCTPDYVKSPHKWKKYDLTKDGSEHYGGLSEEQINKKAAYEFLSSLRTNSPVTENEYSTNDSKIIFRKPHRHSRQIKEESNSFKIKAGKRYIRDNEKAEHLARSNSHQHKEYGHLKSTEPVDNCEEKECDNTEYWIPRKSIRQGHFTGNMYKMPEYVVGSKRKDHIPEKTCKPGKKAKPVKLVTLHHLEDDS